MPYFRVKSEKLVGFAVENDNQGGVLVQENGSLTSESSVFHLFVRNIYNVFLSKVNFPPSLINKLLVILHEDDFADIYINDFKEEARVKAARNLNKGEIVFIKDISDITDIRFPGINIAENDAIVYVVRLEWRFVLYFDFTRRLKRGKLENDIGKLHKKLLFDTLINSAKRELTQSLLEQAEALILTEGKTDWKHLERAIVECKINLNIKLFKFEDAQGGKNLFQMCKQFSKVYQQTKMIFIFDRDDSEVVKKLQSMSEQELAFQKWGNNVYSFMLPVPEHRHELLSMSIELYYKDVDLKKIDKNGRRLFLSNEFDPKSCRHKVNDYNCTDRNKLQGNDLKIVDSDVYDSQGINVALPKSDYANYILNSEPGYDKIDFTAFKLVFSIIEKILLNK